MSLAERTSPRGANDAALAVAAAPAERRAEPAPRRAAAVVPAVAAIFVLGLALRLYCSGGPLWIDEIWSIMNLDPVTHFWRIFWGISHDNNHFANSLWLYFATSFSHCLLYTSPSPRD